MSKHGDGAPLTAEPYSLHRHAVVDDTWKTFGVIFVVLCVAAAAYCVRKAFPASAEGVVPVKTAAPPSFSSAPPLARSPVQQIVPSPPATDQSILWAELTLMIRTGLTDKEVIAVIKGRQQPVPAIGSDQENALRELGAGKQLLDFLRTRPSSAIPMVAPRVVVTATALPRSTAPSGVAGATPSAAVTAPVDYKAKDAQIESLKVQIDSIDQQILLLRNHPNSYSWLGTYNGPGYRYGEESPLKKRLDQLDRERNDLRRQKWQLEGR